MIGSLLTCLNFALRELGTCLGTQPATLQQDASQCLFFKFTQYTF